MAPKTALRQLLIQPDLSRFRTIQVSPKDLPTPSPAFCGSGRLSDEVKAGRSLMSAMMRRAFITLLGSAVICPFAARAEKNDGIRRVGVIMGFAENDEVWQAYLASFRQGLQDLGWTDGHNIRFDYRFTGDSEERMRAMAEEVVGLKPDVIFVSTNSVVSAILKATRSIPIVFTWVADPVRSGFVANLPWPGGNTDA